MNLLVIDTAANLCAACVFDTQAGVERGRAVLDLGKGHAEHLMAVIADALEAAGIAYGDLGGIAVSVGPGSFTGIRVGVSTARGLALALGIPATGVTTLDALACVARERFPGRAVLAALDARNGEFYVARYDAEGVLVDGPRIADFPEARAFLGADTVLAGSAAETLMAAGGQSFDVASTAATADIGVYARLAVRQGFGGGKPSPLYLRDSGAKPQASFVLPRKAE